MARPRGPEKQPMSPSTPPPLRVLPMQLQLGDVLADEIDEWRVVGSPFTIAGGEMVNVRVESVKQAGLTQMRAWGPHERVALRRG